MVEDKIRNVRVAKRLGMRTILVQGRVGYMGAPRKAVDDKCSHPDPFI